MKIRRAGCTTTPRIITAFRTLPYGTATTIMTSSWTAFLSANGARCDAAGISDFGDARGELQATAADAPIVAPLLHLGVLRFAGSDATAFLQGQLSCEVNALRPGQSTWGSYCTPQGRMLASFMLVRRADSLDMLLDRSIVAAIKKRLSMYVLRSKVVIDDASERLVAIGCANMTPTEGEWVPLTGAHRRSVGIFEPGEAGRLWPSLIVAARPVGTACWQWLDITAGQALITAATQDLLVPQMANIDLIGGVSFTKGCYPGQEIVARTHYLGKLKRRMVLAHVETDSSPQPGDPIAGTDLGDQASGTIVSVAAAPQGGYDVLAVVQRSTLDSGVAHLRRLDGPPLAIRSLPYSSD